MLHILAVHGIAVGPDARKLYASKWGATLAASGLEVAVTPCTWESSGCGLVDLARLFSDETYRWRQVALVREQLLAWTRRAPKGSLVVAHSMGQALVASVGSLWGHDLVSIGGPLGHPLVGPALRAVGLGASVRHGLDIWNADDRVCTLDGLQGPEHTTPLGWDSIRVGTATSTPGLFREHTDVEYLSHEFAVDALRRNATARA